MGTKWKQSGIKNPEVGQEWEQSGNKNCEVGQEWEQVRTRTPKWDKNVNKVGTKRQQAQSGKRMGIYWEQNENKNPKV